MTIINTIRDKDKKINRCNYILILLIKKKKYFCLTKFHLNGSIKKNTK